MDGIACGFPLQNRILTLPEENRKDGITSGPFNLREGKSRFEYYTYMYAGMDEKEMPCGTWTKQMIKEK